MAAELRAPRTGNCIPLEHITILHASSAAVQSKNPMMNINLSPERQISMDEDCQADPLFDHSYFKIPEDLHISEISQEKRYYIGEFVVKYLQSKILCEERTSSLIDYNPGTSS